MPQEEPSLGVIPALLHNHASSKVSLTLSLGSVSDRCLQEGFNENWGRKNLPAKFSALMSGIGEQAGE